MTIGSITGLGNPTSPAGAPASRPSPDGSSFADVLDSFQNSSTGSAKGFPGYVSAQLPNGFSFLIGGDASTVGPTQETEMMKAAQALEGYMQGFSLPVDPNADSSTPSPTSNTPMQYVADLDSGLLFAVKGPNASSETSLAQDAAAEKQVTAAADAMAGWIDGYHAALGDTLPSASVNGDDSGVDSTSLPQGLGIVSTNLQPTDTLIGIMQDGHDPVSATGGRGNG